MNKQEFLAQLKKELSGLSQADVQERLNFYSEMIDDRIEEGSSEEEAVFSVGNPREIGAQILEEFPKLNTQQKSFKSWEILLLVLGAPIWFSLLIAALSVAFSVYIVGWSVIVALWSVFVSVLVCFAAGIVCGIVLACHGGGLLGTALIAAGLVCAGLAIFLFFGCKVATKGILLLTKQLALWTKKGLQKRSGHHE